MKQLSIFIAVILIAGVTFAQAPKKIPRLQDFEVKHEKAIPFSALLEGGAAATKVATHTGNSLPTGTVTSSAVTAIKIAQASNSYTSLLLASNQIGVVTNVGTMGGALAFINRQNIQECGGTTPDNGRFRYSISTNGGNSWNVGIGTATATMPLSGCHGLGTINPIYSREARYPNATLFSRSGSSSIDSLGLVYGGPILQPGGTWDGYMTGTVTDANGTFNVTQEDYFGIGGTEYFVYSMISQDDPVSGDQNFWYLTAGWDGMAPDRNILNLKKGVYDKATRTVNWANHKTFTLNTSTSFDGNARATSYSIAFDPTGMHGWIGFVGDLAGGQDTVYNPCFIESTDAGATWGTPVEIDLRNCRELMDSLLLNTLAIDSIGPGMFDTIPFFRENPTTGFDCDLEVDKDGNPHLFVLIGGGSSLNTPDPAYTIITGLGIRHDLWDVTKDQFGDWSAVHVSDQTNFRGTFGLIGSGTASEFTADPYLQVSRSQDGSIMFYSWTDSDTTGGIVTDNSAPDLLTRAFDLNANKMTAVIDRTFDDTDWATKAILPKTGNLALQNMSVFTVPTVIQSLDGGDALQPVSFWYFSDVNFDRDNDFNLDPQYCYNCKENPFANNSAVTDASCMMNNDGAASITAGGGIGPYTYQWDANAGNATTASVSSLAANVYTVVVSDDKECEEVITVIVNNVGAPTATIDMSSVADPACFGDENGTATVMSTGGSGGTMYAWNNTAMETTAAATQLPAGTSVVTVTDNAGCKSFATVTLGSPPAISVVADHTDVSCNGDMNGTVSVILASGGAGGFTYAWDDPNTSTTQTVSGLDGGTYTVTVTDMNSCSETATVTILEPPALTVTPSGTAPTNNSSNDGTASAISTGGTAPYTYAWTDGTGASVGNSSFIFGLGIGSYVVTVTDDNGCVAVGDTIFFLSTAIDDELNAGVVAWDIFPNPTSGQVNVAIEFNGFENANLSIIGMDGKTVVNRSLDNVNIFEEAIDLSNVASGVYLVSLSTAKGMATRKLVVQ